MTEHTEPRFAHKQTRQTRDLLDSAGFVYAGLRSDGHHTYVNPLDGYEWVLAETPSGHWQHQAVQQMLRKRYGIGQRGSFDRDAQRQRTAIYRQRSTWLAETAASARLRIIEERDSRTREVNRYGETRAILHLMGARGSYVP